MIITRNLLSDFFPDIKNFSIEALTKAFFKSGIELESYEEIIAPTGIYYAQIKSFEKIEGSSKLNYCKVFIPLLNEERDIVCGASNVREGIKVIASLPGAKLGDIEIKEREVFGKVSYGMLCSYKELFKSNLLTFKGIEGILELPEDFNINKLFEASDLNLDDIIFELSLPSNRGDLHSAWGLASELIKHLNYEKPINNGKKYSSNWELQLALFTNNFFSTNYEECLNYYIFLAFNILIKPITGQTIKSKSIFFNNLANEFLGNEISEIVNPVTIDIDWGKVCTFLCINETTKQELITKLSKYGFIFENNKCTVPLWRNDINNCKDFIEEIMRNVDLNDIDEKPPIAQYSITPASKLFSLEKVKDFWKNKNFLECSTFNLQLPEQASQTYELFNNEVSTLKNPISLDKSALRKHALFELINVLERNNNLKNALYPIFEITTDLNTLNIVVPLIPKSFPLNTSLINNDLYDLQSFLKRSSSLINQEITFALATKVFPPFLSTNLLQIISNKEIVGYLGYLKAKLPFKVVGAFLSLREGENILKKSPEYSEFPPSYKDISFELSNIEIGKILNHLTNPLLREIQFLERYQNTFLFRFKFQSFEKTLTKEEINASMQFITDTLISLGAKIR
ncbi:hypothetical protein A6V39_02190 [Candidatus Mycoplasma haematobovis]|uniref:phenylalanine--tRNA ligase n=1 Tax=Candidatus Mycoplasma haematobovis TaxID=432608 RepID=A0A1A9QE04_9MOLU|nr:phenylalanine--tRNA ligase subunit beta [Candidatus Mycoplasma haematobovis]OAL10231.1 hypothetical protein A6V39_02190 [Candidatus Mycoplasma haematobovis]